MLIEYMQISLKNFFQYNYSISKVKKGLHAKLDVIAKYQIYIVKECHKQINVSTLIRLSSTYD